ncbi:MAG: trigger factor [Deltaproteobacteria bacterium]|nr:trigger factor [Deltaproteobacteria bacterium]
MKVDVAEISPVQRKVQIELPSAKVTDEFVRAYRDLGRRVRIRGFRAGKAPRTVLQRMYGEEITGEVRSHLVEESLGEVIRDRGMQIVSRPEIDAHELKDGGPFSFSAVFEVKPEIQIQDYLGVEVEKVRFAITDEQVDAALARLQEGHARLEPVENREVVHKGDFITLDFSGSLSGKPFAGGKGENYPLQIGAGQVLPQFETSLIGLKVGERDAIQVPYPEDYPNKEIAGKTVDFEILVRDLKQKVLPTLDDEFAKDHGECASLEELRGKIRGRLEDEFKRYQEEELKEQVLSRILDKHSVTPPPAMVERQTRYLMERYDDRGAANGASDEAPATTEETKKLFEGRAARQIQATLLVEKISQQEKIEVNDRELQERIDTMARSSGERAKTVRDYYARPEAREDLRAQIVFDRTLSFLLEKSLIKEVDPPAPKVDDEGKKS